MDYTNLKPKRQKWLEVALVLLGVLLLIVVLVFIGITKVVDDKTVDTTDIDEDKWVMEDYIKCAGISLVSCIVLYLASINGNKTPPIKTDYEILNFVADKIYEEEGIYLKTSVDNVRIQKGGVDETYIEFLKEAKTFLYLEGTGIIERYTGESIKTVKKGKQGDIIEMELAKGHVARKKILDIHNARLEALGLTEEEQQ